MWWTGYKKKDGVMIDNIFNNSYNEAPEPVDRFTHISNGCPWHVDDKCKATGYLCTHRGCGPYHIAIFTSDIGSVKLN